MVTQTNKREELYREVPPPGDPIPINVEAFEIQDEAPEDAELRAVVADIRNGRAGGASTIRAEDLKAWLQGVVQEEEEEKGNEGKGDRWR
eukprot:14875732-Ditylum_brightwellii.AAC.1